MDSNTRHRWLRYSKLPSMRMQWRLLSGSASPSLRRMTRSTCPALNIVSLARMTCAGGGNGGGIGGLGQEGVGVGLGVARKGWDGY